MLNHMEHYFLILVRVLYWSTFRIHRPNGFYQPLLSAIAMAEADVIPTNPR